MGLFDWIKKKKDSEVQEKEAGNIEERNNISEEIENISEEAENDLDAVKYQEKDNIDNSAYKNKNENTTSNIVITEEPIIIGEDDKEINIDINMEDTESSENSDAVENKPKINIFAKIKSGLEKTRNNLMHGVEQVLKGFTKIDDELFEELEEALIMADIGVDTSINIIEQVKDICKTEKISEVSEIKNVIVRVITEMLVNGDSELELKSPAVILVIGVNGVGKTTTIGKLTHNYKKQGKKVLLAAADTFRAAAIDQLEVWGERNDVQVIRHEENSDPGAVVFDAVQAAKARKSDVLICDTAGRLHNKKNLMEELKKIFKIINREYTDAQLEVFLVLDATTGQNALQQAKLFKEAADITGIVLTKLDGTAKGGIVIAIKNELQIPVRFIGIGEGIDDLQPFNAEQFSKALFE